MEGRPAMATGMQMPGLQLRLHSLGQSWLHVAAKRLLAAVRIVGMLYVFAFFTNFIIKNSKKNSKLKKEYKEVTHICGLSGFGWDDTKKVVTASPQVWDNLIKAYIIFFA